MTTVTMLMMTYLMWRRTAGEGCRGGRSAACCCCPGKEGKESST